MYFVLSFTLLVFPLDPRGNLYRSKLKGFSMERVRISLESRTPVTEDNEASLICFRVTVGTGMNYIHRTDHEMSFLQIILQNMQALYRRLFTIQLIHPANESVRRDVRVA